MAQPTNQHGGGGTSADNINQDGLDNAISGASIDDVKIDKKAVEQLSNAIITEKSEKVTKKTKEITESVSKQVSATPKKSPSATPTTESTKKSNIESTGTDNSLTGIEDISTYIQKKKEKEKELANNPDIVTAQDGTDLKSIPNAYAVVPHKKGDHKLVFLRDDMPKNLIADEKGRKKGSSYVKKGVKVYEVHADYMNHPTLRSRDGKPLGIWIIDDKKDLQHQLQAIQNGAGGGTNFLSPVELKKPEKPLKEKDITTKQNEKIKPEKQKKKEKTQKNKKNIQVSPKKEEKTVQETTPPIVESSSTQESGTNPEKTAKDIPNVVDKKKEETKDSKKELLSHTDKKNIEDNKEINTETKEQKEITPSESPKENLQNNSQDTNPEINPTTQLPETSIEESQNTKQSSKEQSHSTGEESTQDTSNTSPFMLDLDDIIPSKPEVEEKIEEQIKTQTLPKEEQANDSTIQKTPESTTKNEQDSLKKEANEEQKKAEPLPSIQNEPQTPSPIVHTEQPKTEKTPIKEDKKEEEERKEEVTTQETNERPMIDLDSIGEPNQKATPPAINENTINEEPTSSGMFRNSYEESIKETAKQVDPTPPSIDLPQNNQIEVTETINSPTTAIEPEHETAPQTFVDLDNLEPATPISPEQKAEQIDLDAMTPTTTTQNLSATSSTPTKSTKTNKKRTSSKRHKINKVGLIIRIVGFVFLLLLLLVILKIAFPGSKSDSPDVSPVVVETGSVQIPVKDEPEPTPIEPKPIEPVIQPEPEVGSFTLQELEAKLESQQLEARRILNKAKLLGDKEAIKFGTAALLKASKSLEKIKKDSSVTADEMETDSQRVDVYLQKADSIIQ